VSRPNAGLAVTDHNGKNNGTSNGAGVSLSRRRFLELAGVSAVPLLAAGSPPMSTPAAAAPIKRGGTVITSKNWTYASLDPALISEPEMAGMEAMYNGLVRFRPSIEGPQFEVIPDLAESWEQPDPKTIAR
jgi:ABC-type transport system substrate-binding protein